jgi:hypothetical protein
MMRSGWGLFALLGLAAGCGSSESQNPAGCPDNEICDTSRPTGPVHGVRGDGTVDITPDESWPKRGTESAPLTPVELARACAVLAACTDVDLSNGGTEQSARAFLMNACVKPGQYFWEERAVPTAKKNERWSYEGRILATYGGDCNAVAAAATPRIDSIVCEEAGCWWKSGTVPVPTVTCDGDVATLESQAGTTTRDCSHAFAKCDPTSPTGCTDRMPTACEHPAADRCDGDIRLGCDGNGRVSFHDCGRVPGGTCTNVSGKGPSCVYPDQSTCPAQTYGCSGSTLDLCVLGAAVSIDCKSLGFTTCSASYCVK